MIDTVMGRWRVERDYQELKQALGWRHDESRNGSGFHHHVSPSLAACGLLMPQRLSRSKKNTTRSKTRRLPASFQPRGTGAHAARCANPYRDLPLSSGKRDRQNATAVRLLRPRNSETSLMT